MTKADFNLAFVCERLKYKSARNEPTTAMVSWRAIYIYNRHSAEKQRRNFPGTTCRIARNEIVGGIGFRGYEMGAGAGAKLVCSVIYLWDRQPGKVEDVPKRLQRPKHFGRTYYYYCFSKINLRFYYI